MQDLKIKLGRPRKLQKDNNEKYIDSGEALLYSALRITRQKNFYSISIREITRGANLSPASFYRYFDSVEDLGVTIVDQTFAEIREKLQQSRGTEKPLRIHGIRTLKVLLNFYLTRPDHYRLILSLRDSCPSVFASRISAGLDTLTEDLLVDLAGSSDLKHLSKIELQVVANLLTQTTLSIVSKVASTENPNKLLQSIAHNGADELRLIYIGAVNWKTA